jgi:hypothetical protein
MNGTLDLRKSGNHGGEPICGFVIQDAVDLRRPPMTLKCSHDRFEWHIDIRRKPITQPRKFLRARAVAASVR